MRIAIIGSGISGLSAAYYLHREHRVTVFEKADRIGGHTATVDVHHAGRDYAIDTGFIVYNDWTYPRFIELLHELGVDSQPTSMSFSVKAGDSGLEYGGNNLNTLFAQRSNMLKPRFYSMIRDILRFNREAIADLDSGAIDADMRLGDYLDSRGYGEAFRDDYLVPMGSAIWSASIESMLQFPLMFFVRFFKNHGLLSIDDRPQWRVLKDGSRSYLGPLTEGFKENIETGADIRSVTRNPGGVALHFGNGEVRLFDQVVFACHSDQALALLGDASDAEREVLGAIPYQDNEVILHTDESLLPRRRLAWSAWNYWIRDREQNRAVLTYDMNILQGIESDTTFCVTLNATDAIDESKILRRFNYSHPMFSLQSERAVARWGDINGVNHSWFCGAYWANGFHEDGVVSAIRVVDGLRQQQLEVGQVA